QALLLSQAGRFVSAGMDVLQPGPQLVIVVGGKNTTSLLAIVYQKGAFITDSHHTERGQFSSLKIGLQEVLNRGRDTAIVALVDRPAPRVATVRAIKKHFLDSVETGSCAVVPEFEGKHGHSLLGGRASTDRFLR